MEGEILNKYFLVALVFLSGITQAVAAEVSVTEAWVRATADGQDSAAVALHITSQKDANIVEVSSPAANHVEIHSMTHEDGMMKMRELDSFELKARQEVALGRNGNHLMLVGLKKPLGAGDTVKIVMTVQFGDKHKERLEVNAEVIPLTENYEEHKHHHS